MGFVTILDKAASGEKSGTRRLNVSTDKVSLRELIRQRIRRKSRTSTATNRRCSAASFSPQIPSEF